MRVLVTGSRMWSDAATLFAALDQVAAQAAASGEAELTVIHGGHKPSFKNGGYERRSADHLADLWIKQRGHPLPVRAERHPAKWDKCGPWCEPGHRKRRPNTTTYCPSAGHRRNAEMVESGADLVLVFHRNNSRGTAHCAGLAAQAGLVIRRFEATDAP